eukprot:11663483-Ditylum_brightwellii.AAC.3
MNRVHSTGSVVGSVISSGSDFSRSSSRVFLLTPVLPGIQKITNNNGAMYDKGYGTDGDIGPFHDSVEQEEDLFPNIEEEVLSSKEELEALMAQSENPVCNNNDTTLQVVNDTINSNITAGVPGSLQGYG